MEGKQTKNSVELVDQIPASKANVTKTSQKLLSSVTDDATINYTESSLPIPAQRSINFKQISSSSRKNIIYAMTNPGVVDDLVLNNDLGSVLGKPRSNRRQVNNSTNRGGVVQLNGRTLNQSSSKKIAPAVKLPAPSH